MYANPNFFIFSACTGGGGTSSNKNANLGSVDISCEEAEFMTIENDEYYKFPESADFNIILRGASNNEIAVKDNQNIVWTLYGADTECFYFLYSSSLSGSTGTCVMVQFAFELPYDTQAELKVSYGGLSKTVMLVAYD